MGGGASPTGIVNKAYSPKIVIKGRGVRVGRTRRSIWKEGRVHPQGQRLLT